MQEHFLTSDRVALKALSLTMITKPNCLLCTHIMLLETEFFTSQGCPLRVPRSFRVQDKRVESLGRGGSGLGISTYMKSLARNQCNMVRLESCKSDMGQNTTQEVL